MFAKKLNSNSKLTGEVFNFGPNLQNNITVLQVIKKMQKLWKKVDWKIIKKRKKNSFYESKLLQLNCKKAKQKLHWSCVLNFEETISMTIKWYKKFYENPKEIKNFALSQIKYYEKQIGRNK